MIKNNNVSIERFNECLKKVEIVVLSLEQHEDPQIVYDRINSARCPLSKSDLIKNFLLSNISEYEQIELYENYWLELDRKINIIKQKTIVDDKNDKTSDVFDNFFIDYLRYKNKTIRINKELIYRNYIDFVNSMKWAKREALKDLNKVCDLYISLLNVDIPRASNENEFEYKMLVSQFKMIPKSTLMPVFMHLSEKKNVDYEKTIRLMQSILSYLVRYVFCHSPFGEANKFILELLNYFNDENWFIKSINHLLNNKSDKKRFVNNQQFEQAFQNTKIYEVNQTMTKFVLKSIELKENWRNFNLNKTNDGVTIEHVLPERKEVTDGWKRMLGQNYQNVYDQYVHTIGNLTLVTNNAQLSDNDFDIKQNMPNGYKDTNIYLNKELIKTNVWNKETIINRANILWNVAKNIWIFPELNEQEQMLINTIKPMNHDYNKIEYKMTGEEVLNDTYNIIKTYFGTTTIIDKHKDYINIKTNNKIVFVTDIPRSHFITLRMIDPNNIIINNGINVRHRGNRQHFGTIKANYSIIINEFNLDLVNKICQLIKENYGDEIFNDDKVVKKPRNINNSLSTTPTWIDIEDIDNVAFASCNGLIVNDIQKDVKGFTEALVNVVSYLKSNVDNFNEIVVNNQDKLNDFLRINIDNDKDFLIKIHDKYEYKNIKEIDDNLVIFVSSKSNDKLIQMKLLKELFNLSDILLHVYNEN